MIDYIGLMFASFIALIVTFFITYPIKHLAWKWHVLDHPEQRKMHEHITPRMGGLAIFIGFSIGLLVLHPEHIHMKAVFLGGCIIVLTGLLDDRYTIRPIIKLSGQLAAAIVLVMSGPGLVIEKITLPFLGMIDLGILAIPITILWVVGITNAINLIDGLDGLATGISTIALTVFFIMSLIDLRIIAAYLSIILIGANIGFLYHNFYPAKIYMGDTGSNFLGYMIAVISMLGLFKNIALLSFVIPVIILAVPIVDTVFAIVRRLMHHQHIMQPDNKHIHYQLLKAGLTHKQSVLVMYAFSGLFGIFAIFLARASAGMTLIAVIIIFILVHLLAEIAGLVLGGQQPVINFFRKIFKRKKREN